MNTQLSKNFIVTLLAVVLALGGLTWLSERSSTKDAPQVAANTDAVGTRSGTRASDTQLRQDGGAYPVADNQTNKTGTPADAASAPGYEEGYRAGYQDGERDCAQSHAAARGGRYYSGRRYYSSRSYARRGVAGVSYVAPRRGHSTRNMILTVAAPAALGAGIGGIAGGGKGAGIGALLGGGGGALYYLLKHRQ